MLQKETLAWKGLLFPIIAGGPGWSVGQHRAAGTRCPGQQPHPVSPVQPAVLQPPVGCCCSPQQSKALLAELDWAAGTEAAGRAPREPPLGLLDLLERLIALLEAAHFLRYRHELQARGCPELTSSEWEWGSGPSQSNAEFILCIEGYTPSSAQGVPEPKPILLSPSYFMTQLVAVEQRWGRSVKQDRGEAAGTMLQLKLLHRRWHVLQKGWLSSEPGHAAQHPG